jgi:hypothetical protein
MIVNTIIAMLKLVFAIPNQIMASYNESLFYYSFLFFFIKNIFQYQNINLNRFLMAAKWGYLLRKDITYYVKQLSIIYPMFRKS